MTERPPTTSPFRDDRVAADVEAERAGDRLAPRSHSGRLGTPQPRPPVHLLRPAGRPAAASRDGRQHRLRLRGPRFAFEIEYGQYAPTDFDPDQTPGEVLSRTAVSLRGHKGTEVVFQLAHADAGPARYGRVLAVSDAPCPVFETSMTCTRGTVTRFVLWASCDRPEACDDARDGVRVDRLHGRSVTPPLIAWLRTRSRSPARRRQRRARRRPPLGCRSTRRSPDTCTACWRGRKPAGCRRCKGTRSSTWWCCSSTSPPTRESNTRRPRTTWTRTSHRRSHPAPRPARRVSVR